jgi:uncharacterized YigZ family protein
VYDGGDFFRKKMAHIKDTYKTIETESNAEFKDRGSKFIAYTTPLSIEADFPIFLEKIKKEHPKARHHCYAWRLGMDGNRFRAKDDGEPSGTAGRPILGQIDSFGLTNVGIVVVRYFGGTLLGTSGLINAYRESAAEALRQAIIVEKIVEDIVEIIFGYDKMPDVMNALKRLDINILSQVFEETGKVIIGIRQSETEAKLNNLRALIMKMPIEQVLTIENTEGVVINLLR